jgi:hypothetical protein
MFFEFFILLIIFNKLLITICNLKNLYKITKYKRNSAQPNNINRKTKVQEEHKSQSGWIG